MVDSLNIIRFILQLKLQFCPQRWLANQQHLMAMAGQQLIEKKQLSTKTRFARLSIVAITNTVQVWAG
jgi:hypothetical protein